MDEEKFPILFDADERRDYPKGWPKCARAVPLEAVAPFERQAHKNHMQTLKRLAERGGLSPCELVAVMHCADFYDAWPRFGSGFWKEYQEKNRAPHPDHLRAILFVNSLARGEDPHGKCDKHYCAVTRERLREPDPEELQRRGFDLIRQSHENGEGSNRA